MVDTTSTKLIAELIGCCKTKVRDSDPKTVIEAENVLRLQISVINSEGMAIFHSIEELKEDVLDEGIVPKIAAAMQDLSEEIMVGCVIHHDVGETAFLHNTMEGNHAWVRRCELMQGNFSYVDLAMTWVLMP